MKRAGSIAERRAALRAESAATRAELIVAVRRVRGDAGMAVLGLAAARLLARRPLLAGIAGAGLAAWRLLQARRSSNP